MAPEPPAIDRVNGTAHATRKTAPARHQRVPEAAAQLSSGLAWLSLVSKRRVSDQLIRSVMEHHRRTRCDPAILIAAVVQYLILNADREQDHVNRYWHLVDQISARTRTRYLNIDEQELQ